MANSKDVVVTGVSTGIGWGTTKVLVSEGISACSGSVHASRLTPIVCQESSGKDSGASHDGHYGRRRRASSCAQKVPAPHDRRQEIWLAW